MVRSVNVKKTKSSKKIILKITMSMTLWKPFQVEGVTLMLGKSVLLDKVVHDREEPLIVDPEVILRHHAIVLSSLEELHEVNNRVSSIVEKVRVSLADLFLELVQGGRRSVGFLSPTRDVLPTFALFASITDRPSDFCHVVKFGLGCEFHNVVKKLLEASRVVHELGGIASSRERHIKRMGGERGRGWRRRWGRGSLCCSRHGR